MQQSYNYRIGVILTDSWLMPGRYGTTGIAIAMAGFQPIKDERGKQDLFGNAMTVTQIGVADSLAVCAQVVMGERDEATPFAVARGAAIEFTQCAAKRRRRIHTLAPLYLRPVVDARHLARRFNASPQNRHTYSREFPS